ncbi:MAG: hypothetical protein ACAI44_07130 [Candidatus Sericytochromatia bacterium]
MGKTAWFTSLSVLLLATPAFASDSAWVLKRGSMYWELQGGYGRFSEASALTHQLDFKAHAEIGILETATLVLEVPFLTRSLERSGQTPAYLTNNGLTDFYLGTRVRLLEEPFGLALKGSAKVPTGYDPSFTPVIGDHTLDLELGLNAGYDFFPLEAYVQGGLGYRLRNNFDRTHAIPNLAKAQGLTVTKPADQITGFAEVGAWLLPQLFASIGLNGAFGLNQAGSWVESQLLLSPQLAWRLNPYVDVSLQLDQALWSQRMPFLTQVMAGAHFRYGLPLDRGTGLRGSVPDYAEHDDSID